MSRPEGTYNKKLRRAPIHRLWGWMLVLLLLFTSCRTPEPVILPLSEEERMEEALKAFLYDLRESGDPFILPPGTRITDFEIDRMSESLAIRFSDPLSYVPFRPFSVDRFYQKLRWYLPSPYREYHLRVFTMEEPIEHLIPNYYREAVDQYDFRRLPYTDKRRPEPVVRRLGRHVVPAYGLDGRQIALWHSHGWYYNQEKKRWEWQRPRLFQTVEDLLPMAFTIPYLIPMLENAGAYVWTPRERDLNPNEALVDSDGSTGNSFMEWAGEPYHERYAWYGRIPEEDDVKVLLYEADREYIGLETWIKAAPGFGAGQPPYEDGVNPFRTGSFHLHPASPEGDSFVRWIPEVPEKGRYAVYISYVSLDESVSDARYRVYHKGGYTDFHVNQQIGGGTWIYLGHFEFDEGVHSEKGRIELSTRSRSYGVVTADAVRIGGGMGNIVREGSTGGRPRYQEAARYHMQYLGMPDSLVYRLSGGASDLIDDIQGRGEWVNFLTGNPYGPNNARKEKGLGIPIDVSLAFHTDAGTTTDDSVIGTLMIYSTEGLDSLNTFPDQVSRLANRDFADIMQTQIVEDIRKTWNPEWNRRFLFNRRYSEAVRPNVPSVLLELLSHQNFSDMQYAHDPQFRFDVSRSIYKSMVRFIAHRNQQDYIIQPLPVSHVRVLPYGERQLRVAWEPVSDPLETTATPDRFIIYKSKDFEPFDQGRVTDRKDFIFRELEPGSVYRFKVVAVNDGGKSFPSEIVSAGVTTNHRSPVLVVNGYERVSGPEAVDEKGFRGFASFLDPGVPDREMIHFTGTQFDFDPNSAWKTNDAPGHGASHADYETQIIAGNTFDFMGLYGRHLLDMNRPFVSASVEAVRNRMVDLADYEVVLMAFGNQKTILRPHSEEGEFQVFPLRLQEELIRYLDLGGKLFISGSHIGSDVERWKAEEPSGINFIKNYLGYQFETNHAARRGVVQTEKSMGMNDVPHLKFHTEMNSEMYHVYAPDAIIPVRRPDRSSFHQETEVRGSTERNSLQKALTPSGPEVLLRYHENQFVAGVGYRTDHYAVVSMGFPFEALLEPDQREKLLRAVLRYLGDEE
ncbi:fibronectin type III domain-containing protein [Balneolaceae bacterium ANBcel3]|nr:fibronectin type III domain-containing protein [Balneolaceae bacterium ANBcel3]